MLCYNIATISCYITLLNSNSVTAVLDKLAVTTSSVCAIHCLALPVMLTIFPALGNSFFGDEHFHEMLLLAVVPMSMISLTIGCKKHKDIITLG